MANKSNAFSVILDLEDPEANSWGGTLVADEDDRVVQEAYDGFSGLSFVDCLTAAEKARAARGEEIELKGRFVFITMETLEGRDHDVKFERED